MNRFRKSIRWMWKQGIASLAGCMCLIISSQSMYANDKSPITEEVSESYEYLGDLKKRFLERYTGDNKKLVDEYLLPIIQVSSLEWGYAKADLAEGFDWTSLELTAYNLIVEFTKLTQQEWDELISFLRMVKDFEMNPLDINLIRQHVGVRIIGNVFINNLLNYLKSAHSYSNPIIVDKNVVIESLKPFFSHKSHRRWLAHIIYEFIVNELVIKYDSEKTWSEIFYSIDGVYAGLKTISGMFGAKIYGEGITMYLQDVGSSISWKDLLRKTTGFTTEDMLKAACINKIFDSQPLNNFLSKYSQYSITDTVKNDMIRIHPDYLKPTELAAKISEKIIQKLQESGVDISQISFFEMSGTISAIVPEAITDALKLKDSVVIKEIQEQLAQKIQFVWSLNLRVMNAIIAQETFEFLALAWKEWNTEKYQAMSFSEFLYAVYNDVLVLENANGIAKYVVERAIDQITFLIVPFTSMYFSTAYATGAWAISPMSIFGYAAYIIANHMLKNTAHEYLDGVDIGSWLAYKY